MDMKNYYGEKNSLNTLTLKTEGTKSTVLVCAKGLGINNDDAQFLADLIPFERGANWSLNDCFYGNEEKNRKPQIEFIKEVEKYPRLKETLLKIEGLISGRSIHASASYIFDDGYLAQNSKMRAPNGSWITAFNMEDSDYMGALKVDTLTIITLDKIHKTIDLLIKDGVIEDKGSIKKNYDTYLHPDVLEHDDYKMWNLLDKNSILDAFQFDTPMGKQVISKTQPRSIFELTAANSLMRLMAQDGAEEAPMDTYKRYKDNINLWYEEMKKYGLNTEEMEVMKKHLSKLYGVADTQESIMQLSMDDKIAGFDVVDANRLRKSVAKKKADLVNKVREKFFESGKKLGNREEILKYVWNVQIFRQLGYSFSINHCQAYSEICIQCMNLVLRYGAIYWNCACLIINSGSNEEMEDEGVKYGKISKAMGNMQKEGIKISLPDINRSEFGFFPDAEKNEIVYGLKPIVGVGSKVAKTIIENRPYYSLFDFYEKMNKIKEEDKESKFGNVSMISLIKAGCFDKLENRPRTEIMKTFAKMISNPIKSLKMSNIEDLNELGLLTETQKKYELRFYKFRQYLYQKKFFYKQTGKSPTTAYYILDKKYAEPYFFENFETNMTEEKDYEYTSDGYIAVKKGSLDRVIDKLTMDFKDNVLSNEKILEQVNNKRFKLVWDNLCQGTLSKWEMDSLSYYYHEHELANVDRKLYNIANFFELSENPAISDYYVFRGQEKPRFRLYRICGTVLGREKNKHITTLLTPDGVVDVKFYKGQFTFYDKQISNIDEYGKKTVLEKSWFTRGTKLLITGYRRGENFVPKQYKDSIYKHSVQLIEDINNRGELTLKSDRISEGNEEDES